MMKRLTVVFALVATVLVPLPAHAAEPEWVGAGYLPKVYDPGTRYLNDHTVIKGHDGLWHMFAITGNNPAPGTWPDPSREDFFAHATAPALTGPWTTRPHVMHVDPGYHGEDHVWAPHVISHDGTYYMFYAAGVGANAAINLATSTDLYTWTRLPSGPLFRDGLEARDPMVIRIGTQWVMYYCATERADGGRHVVAYRTSSDLIRWSGRQIAYIDPTHVGNAPSNTESPFVVQRNGWYYLFIGPRGGYTGTDVFRSQDPFRFNLADWAGHVPSHAAEVVPDGTAWWVTHAGWWQRGLYIGRLNWQAYAPVWQNRSNPVVARNADGRLEAFAVNGSDNRIMHRWQTSPNGPWSVWQEFGGALSGSTPSVGQHADGRLIVFSIAPDGSYLGTRSQVASSGGWGPWQMFGGPAGAVPAVGRNADGRLEVFALGPAGKHIAHRWQTAPSGPWSDWFQFGGPAGAPPAVASNADGRMDVFAVGPAGDYIAHRYQTAPSGGWSNWENFGGPAAAMTPTVGRNADGRLDVFALDPYGGGLHNRYQTRPSGGWSSWFQFGGPAGAPPTVVNNADGRMEVLAMGPGNDYISHRWQVAPSGNWSNWEGFGGPAQCTPSAAAQADGRLMVIALAAGAEALNHRTQAVPSGGWLDWAGFVAPGGRMGNFACGQAS